MAELPKLITQAGYDQLRAEMEQLWKIERPKVTREVEVAAAHGDRSENAEYQYGKRRLREIDRRLRFLSKRLESLQIVSDAAQRRNEGKVGFGAWVVIENEDDGQEHCYRIVGADEFDPDQGYISIESPVGRALLNKAVGDDVEVRRPKGPAWFTVLEIHYGQRPR